MKDATKECDGEFCMLIKSPGTTEFPAFTPRFKSFSDYLKYASYRVKEAKEHLSETWGSKDTSNLVTARMYRPDQLKMLGHLLPRGEVDAIKLMASMISTGLTNYSCPPPELPWLTEEYTAPDGVKRCRVPSQLTTMKETMTTKCPPEWDLTAVEAFVKDGKASCRRPVMYGARFCPENDAGKKAGLTQLIVDKNMRGVCVDPAQLYNISNVGASHAVYPYNLMELIQGDLKALMQTGITRLGSLERFNKMLLSFEDTQGLVSAIAMDPELQKLERVASRISSKDDAKLFNDALYIFMRGSQDYKPSVDQWLNFFGTTPEQFVRH